MKILHRFSQSQWSKTKLFCIFCILTLQNSFSQKFTDTLSTLFQINKKATKEFKFLDLRISKSHQLNTDQFRYYINKDYLLSVFFELPQPLSKVLSSKKCALLEMMTYGLFKNHEIVILDEVNKLTNSVRQVKALSSLVIPLIYKKQCPILTQRQKASLQNLSFVIPKESLSPRDNFFQCEQDIKNFSQSSNFIQALLLTKKIKTNNKLRKTIINSKNLSKKEAKKLVSFYDHFTKATQICNPQKTLKISEENYGHIKNNFITPICVSKYKDKAKKENCIKNFAELKKTCMEAFPFFSFQLFPHQDCKTYLELLSISKQVLNAPDLKFYGQSLKQAFRIFAQVRKIKKLSSPTFANFVDFLEEEGKLDYLQSSFCYQHKFLKSQICQQTFFSQSPHYLSVNNQVQKALRNQKIIPKTMKCSFAEESEQGNILENDYGCKITYLKKRCYINFCPFQVYINGRLAQIKFNSMAKFKFPFQNYTSKNDFNYFIHTLKRKFKIQEVKVSNTTQIARHLQRHQSVIYGTACVEDLLPTRFHRESFSQCSPTLFTLTGSDKNTVVIQLAIENNNFVRGLSWKDLKMAIESFVKLTQQTWSLYALKI